MNAVNIDNTKSANRHQSRFYSDPSRHARMQIQDRDLDIIAATLQHQFLTTDNIQKLFFSVDGYKATARRLQMIWNSEFLARQYVPSLFGSTPAIYSPTQSGINLLIEHGWANPDQINWRCKHNHTTAESKRHELKANELVVELMVAVAGLHNFWCYEEYPSYKGGKQLIKRVDLPKLQEVLYVERGSQLWDYVENPNPKDKTNHPYIPIRPDRLLVMKLNNQWKNLLIEIEISPKNQARLRRRFRGYRIYYISNSFLKRYGKGTDRAQYPFNVLITTPTEERRNNLIEMAITENCLKMCLFAIYDEAVADPLGQIWIRGEDYKEALARLPESDLKRFYKSHRRIERDRFIRERVRKISLLEA